MEVVTSLPVRDLESEGHHLHSGESSFVSTKGPRLENSTYYVGFAMREYTRHLEIYLVSEIFPIIEFMELKLRKI